MPRSQPEHPSEPPSGEQTRIIRRAPTGPIPTAADEPSTAIIRRAPAGPAPIPPAARGGSGSGGPGTAVAACVVAMLSGWTTAVLATDLIIGWWDTDRLFCAAVGFLALVFAGSTMSGVVLVLLRRPVGRYLIVAGAVVALLAFGGVFIAGASIPWIVYLMPLLPVSSAVLAVLPATGRWTTAG